MQLVAELPLIVNHLLNFLYRNWQYHLHTVLIYEAVYSQSNPKMENFPNLMDMDIIEDATRCIDRFR